VLLGGAALQRCIHPAENPMALATEVRILVTASLQAGCTGWRTGGFDDVTASLIEEENAFPLEALDDNAGDGAHEWRPMLCSIFL
jgi:hypothetical protein